MDPIDSYPLMLSAGDVCELTGISVERLNAWRKLGRGPVYIKMGDGPNGAVRYPREDLRTYIAARRVGSAQNSQAMS
jgi:predicted site-specific integrase-resolvase